MRRNLFSLDVLIVGALALVVVGPIAWKQVQAQVTEATSRRDRPAVRQVSFEFDAPPTPRRARMEFVRMQDGDQVMDGEPVVEWDDSPDIEYRPAPHSRMTRCR